jgi:hypothetical protein
MFMTFWTHLNPGRARVALRTCAAALAVSTMVGAAAVPATNAPAPPQGIRDTMEFLNGDVLRGAFLSLDDKGGVRWQHASIKPVLTVNPSGIYKVRLPQGKITRSQRPDCAVRLVNGDELLGNLVSLDETNLQLETWYAGTLNLPRPGLQSLTMGLGRYQVLFEGPTGMEGWSTEANPNAFGGGMVVINGVLQAQPARKMSNGWQYKDDAFYGIGSGSLGRDFKLPPVSNIEFDLTWRGYPQLSVSFYTDTLKGYGGNAYVLQISYRNLYLRRQQSTGASANLGQMELPALSRNKARFSIRTDREKKLIALFIDDTLVKQWTDNAELIAGGTGLLFTLQGGQQAMKLSGIRIAEWDGRLDDLSAVTASPKEDLAKLANKDKVSGTLKSIRDGKMSFATAFAVLEVPLSRINQIEFAPTARQTNQFNAKEVRVIFADQGRLTMQVERWDDQQVVGKSIYFGQAKFAPSAFAAIQFNLDKQKVDTDAFESSFNVPFQPEVFVDE